jgi:hypothetical protein
MDEFTRTERRSVVGNLLGNLSGDALQTLNSSGRYYTIDFNYVEYYKYLNCMLSAVAAFLGIYEEKISFIQPLKETVSKDGKNRNENYLNLFNMNIPLYIGKNKFDSYSINTQINEYSLFKRKLPISITKNTITEQIYTEKNYTDEEAKKLIDEKIFIYEKNFLENKKILNRDIKHYVDNNELHTDVIYSIEADIGIKSDIFIK